MKLRNKIIRTSLLSLTKFSVKMAPLNSIDQTNREKMSTRLTTNVSRRFSFDVIVIAPFSYILNHLKLFFQHKTFTFIKNFCKKISLGKNGDLMKCQFFSRTKIPLIDDLQSKIC